MISQLIIPKIIDVEQFGLYKTFTLYLAFTSLFHFGYKDGLYIWFCNKRDELQSKKESFSSVLFIQQIFITLLLLLIGLFFDNQIRLMIHLLAFTTLFNIGYTFFEIYYQSLKIFKPTVYFKFFKEFSFFIAIVTIYALEISINAFSLIEIVVAVSFATTLFYWAFSKWNFFRFAEIKQYLEEIKNIYKNGVHLLVGNLTHQISTNLDKLFISSFFTSQVFGIYAFGATFFILANVLLVSISTFLLPYLFDKKLKESLSYTKLINIPFKVFPIYIIYFFVVIYIVNNYFLEYTDSLKYFAALNLAIVMNISVSIIQTNFLKSLNLEKLYSKINSILLLVLFLLLLIIHFFKLNLLFVPITVSFSFLLRFIINDFFIKSRLKLKFFNLKSFLWFLLIIILYFSGLNYIL